MTIPGYTGAGVTVCNDCITPDELLLRSTDAVYPFAFRPVFEAEVPPACARCATVLPVARPVTVLAELRAAVIEQRAA